MGVSLPSLSRPGMGVSRTRGPYVPQQQAMMLTSRGLAIAVGIKARAAARRKLVKCMV